MDFYSLLDQLIKELRKRRINPDDIALQNNDWDYSQYRGGDARRDSNPVYSGLGRANNPGASRLSRIVGLEMMNPELFAPYPQNRGNWDLDQGLGGMMGYGGTLDRPPEFDSPLSRLRNQNNIYR